jgi:filamentous hemagglutinin family protein
MARSSISRSRLHTCQGRRFLGSIWLVAGIPIAELILAHASMAAGVLPQGGRYVAGAGTIAGDENRIVVTQPGSSRGVIDWRSFSIGKDNTVTIDNGAGATLNRVTGGSPSAILGNLRATGSLYVINPQGVIVGPSGVVSTGGRFVASTLDICNCAFMTGVGALTFSGKSNASVVNLGKIGSSGGDVFLIARHDVVNAGIIKAHSGTAELASGETVLLQDSTSSRQVFVQTGSHGTVVNDGRIVAAQVSLQAADGNVYALAGSGTRIHATGTGTRDGHVWLLAGSGRVEQTGKIVARNADGSGATVDTQAAHVGFGKHADVQAGQWNLSTPELTVDDAAAGVLQRSLSQGTSVNVTTTGGSGATGDLSIASSMLWHSPASLSLAAYRSISVAAGATVANKGAGNLALRADASGIDNGGSIVNRGAIDWSASTGTVGMFYDMNGAYAAGTQVANATWTPGANSGLVRQITAYNLVNSLTDLKNIASNLAGNYALGKNIDASASSDSSFVPIGNAVTPFSGQFDGQGKKISSLTLQPWLPSDVYSPQLMGMFGVIGSTGVVRNMNVSGSGHLGEQVYGYMGVLAGMNNGQVVGVNVSGNLSSGGDASSIDYTIAGGLAGGNSGTVSRSSSSVAITAGNTLGGLVGANDGVISQSFASGALQSVSYINQGAGGLAGNNAGTITQSYATGPTLLQGYCRGASGTPCGGAGLVVVNSGTINQSFATGAVTQPFYQPIGIARGNTGTIASDVYWDKDSTHATIGVRYGTGLPAANGLTSAQMATPASFKSYDFGSNGVWAMPVGATHPVLRWQVAQ